MPASMVNQPIMIPASYFTTAIGLSIAFLGPAILFTPAHRLLGAPDRNATRVFELLFLWFLAGLLFSILIWWEQLPLASIGFQPRWRSLVLGLLLALLFSQVVEPFLYWMITRGGMPGFESGLAKIVGMPTWYLLFAAVTAGIVEESLYRGYAVERLALLADSYWWAALGSTTVFALLHWPMWGWGPRNTWN
jgi:uncharacterized protein